jgi:hypothetical protein
MCCHRIGFFLLFLSDLCFSIEVLNVPYTHIYSWELFYILLISLSVFPSEFISFPICPPLCICQYLLFWQLLKVSVSVSIFIFIPHLDYSSIHWYLFSLLLSFFQISILACTVFVFQMRGKGGATLLNKNRQTCWDWQLLPSFIVNFFLYNNQGPVNNLPNYIYTTHMQGAVCVRMDAGNSLSCASNTIAMGEMPPSKNAWAIVLSLLQLV